MGSYWETCKVMSACDQTSPSRRKGRLLCGAKTRAGGCCQVRAEPGKARCRFHGGRSTGPKTQAGRARIAEAAVARLSREASSEWPEMRATLDRKVEVAAEKRRYLMESVGDDVTPAACHRKRSHDDSDRC